VPRRYESLRVFDNPLLESLTHVHPATPILVWGPIVVWLIWRSFAVHGLSVTAVLGFAMLGLTTWSLAEYLLHRYLFHMRPAGPFRARLQFMIHGLHHDDPEDPTRLVLPPVPTCLGAVVFFTAFRALLGPARAEPVFAFFAVGYLVYDYIHFASHRFVPWTRVGRALKRNHMLHHYSMPHSHWGVSSPLWDYVFGTTGKDFS
jgi:sterol desaturase/sphingolipid hydroxylase (fatty acid hydroxylase superfamily)